MTDFSKATPRPWAVDGGDDKRCVCGHDALWDALEYLENHFPAEAAELETKFGLDIRARTAAGITIPTERE